MNERAQRRGSGRRQPESEQTAPVQRSQSAPSMRWVCECTNPPTLLATYDGSGRIEVKVRDRRYIARDRLLAICPRCGTRHLLQIRGLPATTADADEPNSASQSDATDDRDPETHELEHEREP